MNGNQSPPSRKTDQKENTKMEEYNIESVIQEILNGKESWTIDENMPLLVQELDNLKTDLKMFLENCDFDIPALLSEAADLCAVSTDLVNEMTACKTEIEQETMAEIRKSIESHDKTAKDLEKVNFAIDIVNDVGKCETYLKLFEEGREGESYSLMVESVCDMLEYINHPADGFQQLDLYTQFRTYGNLLLDKLSQALYQEWDNMFCYSITPDSQKTIITLNITVKDNPKSFDIISALKTCKKFTERLAEFSIFMLKEVFAPVVKNDTTMTVDSDEQITITIHHSKSNSRPKYSDVIQKMRTLFNFIHDRFSGVYTLMQMFGQLICIDFCNLMVNDCFIHTVPTNINDLQLYSWITSEIEAFQHFLMTLKMFPDEGLSLLRYMENIDVLFADSSSRHFLETARSIMLKDLSVTMSIGHEEIPEDTSDTSRSMSEMQNTTEEALDIFEKTIPKSLFYFPRCLISKTAQELLDLVYVIMEQAVQCPDLVCKTLYQAVRLIFELYDAVVPYHHENYLQTIPQYVALFHNNCMYLAHNLQTLGDKWLALMEGRELDYAIGFVDLVQKVRELGYKHLTMHMQQQRKQILDNIRSSDLNCIVTKDVLGDNAEAAVRQCLRQLQLLKNVWIGVFPANVFTKLMATLVNMFVDELIHRVCTVEDISVEMATQLADMYTLVVQKAPQLFTTPTDVDKYVKSWTKLQELIFVLGGSLKDIENHWDDGTGPLAVHFEVDELRSLIKALFQNTQFRANLLSKIK